MKTTVKWVLGTVCAFLVFAMFADKTKYNAKYKCETEITSKLKSPNTANFPETMATISGDEITVTGVVDAQNGFGATVRNSFICRMKKSTVGEVYFTSNPVMIGQ